MHAHVWSKNVCLFKPVGVCAPKKERKSKRRFSFCGFSLCSLIPRCVATGAQTQHLWLSEFPPCYPPLLPCCLPRHKPWSESTASALAPLRLGQDTQTPTWPQRCRLTAAHTCLCTGTVTLIPVPAAPPPRGHRELPSPCHSAPTSKSDLLLVFFTICL